MNNPTQSVWQRLSVLGLVEVGNEPELPIQSPWYIKTLLAFSGWLSALFGFAFLAAIGFGIFESPTACVVVGIVLMLIAIFISRTRNNEFVDNIALAVSLIGQGLFAWGIASLGDDENLKVLYPALTVMYVVLIVFSNSYLHRALFALFLVVTTTLWFTDLRLPLASVNALILPAALLWFNEFRWPVRAVAIRPVAYGLTIGIIVVNAFIGWGGAAIGDMGIAAYFQNAAPSWWQANLYKAASAIALLYVVSQCLKYSGRLGANLTSALGFAGALALIWAAFPAPGIVTGVIVLLCGFAASNRVLTGLGIIALLTFMSSYYYQMDTTLLVKATSLAIVGVGLLAARVLMLLAGRQ